MWGLNPQPETRSPMQYWLSQPASQTFWEFFWLLIQFLCWLSVCSNFPFLSVSVLVVYMFLGVYPFFEVVHFVGIQFFIIRFSYNCLHFCGGVISSLSFVMLLVWVLSLFSWKVWQEVYPSYWFFFLFSKNKLLEMPAWLSWLSICLRLSSWSQGPGIESRIRLLAQQGACFSLYLLLSLSSAPPACALSLSLWQRNKI